MSFLQHSLAVFEPTQKCFFFLFSIFSHLPFQWKVRNYLTDQKGKQKDTDAGLQGSAAVVRPGCCNSHFIPVKPLDNPRVPFLGPGPKHSVTEETK